MLRLRSSDASELASAHLILVLMDRDLTDADDRLGAAVLPLRDVLAAAKAGGASRQHAFSLPVVKGTVVHGSVAGTVELRQPTRGFDPLWRAHDALAAAPSFRGDGAAVPRALRPRRSTALARATGCCSVQ